MQCAIEWLWIFEIRNKSLTKVFLINQASNGTKHNGTKTVWYQTFRVLIGSDPYTRVRPGRKNKRQTKSASSNHHRCHSVQCPVPPHWQRLYCTCIGTIHPHLNVWSSPMLQDREALTRMQLAEAPSLAMWSLRHQQEVYSLAGFEAIWNETISALRLSLCCQEGQIRFWKAK